MKPEPTPAQVYDKHEAWMRPGLKDTERHRIALQGALLAERERAAKTAENHRLTSLCVNGFSLHSGQCITSQSSCQQGIAAAIRDQGSGKCTVHEVCIGRARARAGRKKKR